MSTTPSETQPSAQAASVTSSPPGNAATLVAVLLAVLVVPMSISGTAVALPAIAGDIGGGPAGQQWVVNAFNLAFACFTLVWGSLADRFGRGRLFLLGATVFAVGSVLSALAPSIAVLDVARAVAGLGGAAIFSCGSAMLSSRYTGEARLKAFALFGTTAGVGVALGPTVSGVLIEAVHWQAIFVVQAIVLVVVLGFARVIGWQRPISAPTGRFDVRGTTLFILGLLAVMVGIVQGQSWGWASPAGIVVLVLAVCLLAGFAFVESHTASPLLDLELLTHPRFLALCLVPVAASFGFVTLLTYFPTFLQYVVGQSSLQAGLTAVLLTAPVVVGPIAAARAVAAGLDPMTVIWTSIAALLVGDVALLTAGSHSTVLLLAVPLLLAGAGMGLSAGLVDGQALSLVPDEKAGMAAGVINTMRLGSEAVAVAIYASLLTGLVGGTTGTSVASVGDYTHGFRITVATMAVVVALLAVTVAALLRVGTRK